MLSEIRTLLRRARSLSDEDRAALEAYRSAVNATLTRVPQIQRSWQELNEVEHEDARLANTASVRRWELVRLASELESVRPPKPAAEVHQDLVAAVSDAARACRLLANGHRFHKSHVTCDGHVLLLEAVDGVEGVRRALDALG